MNEQIINKEKQYKNIWGDDTIDFPLRIGMLDNAKTRWEKDSYSRNGLATQDLRGY